MDRKNLLLFFDNIIAELRSSGMQLTKGQEVLMWSLFKRNANILDRKLGICCACGKEKNIVATDMGNNYCGDCPPYSSNKCSTCGASLNLGYCVCCCQK